MSDTLGNLTDEQFYGIIKIFLADDGHSTSVEEDGHIKKLLNEEAQARGNESYMGAYFDHRVNPSAEAVGLIE